MDIKYPQPIKQPNESSQQPVTNFPGETKPKSKKIIIIIVVALLVMAAGILAIVLLIPSGKSPSSNQEASSQTNVSPQNLNQATAQPPAPEEDSTAAINSQLNTINISDVDSQFKDIDNSINNL